MSLTTDALDAIRDKLTDADQQPRQEAQIGMLMIAVDKLVDLVEKLHARILFLEQQQQRSENY